jgi:hypothetical protein
MNKYLLASVLAFSSISFADVPEQIKNLAGCFTVSYRFIEDGTHDVDIHGTFEEMVPETKPDGSYFLQHYGIMDGQKQKHFGESWTAGKAGWTQVVYSPSGTVRYTCPQAVLEFNQYKCEVKNAPKPVRDRNRTDYETLDREITIQMTPKGFTQAERNIKRDKDNNAVSNEVGWIEYNRTDVKNCNP